MKDVLICTVICMTIISACTKSTSKPEANLPQESPVEVNNKHKIDFNLSDFDISYERKANQREVSAKDYLRDLWYLAFDSTGTMVRKLRQNTQDSRSPVTGTFSDSLKPGKYTVILMGSSSNNAIYPNLDTLNIGSNKLMGLELNAYADFFYKKLKIDIVSKDTVIANILLAKMHGFLQINLLDTIPPAVTSIETRVYDYSYIFNVAVDSVNYQNPTKWLGWVVPIGPQYYTAVMGNYYLGSSYKHKVEISAYAGSNLIAQKTIQNVYIYINKKTVLTGKLFDSGLGVTIGVNVDPDFPDTIYQNF